LLIGYLDWRVARHRARGYHRHVVACDLCFATGVGIDHVGGYLLRRAIRRFNHRHIGQFARRIFFSGDHTRWLPDGASRACRSGLGSSRHVLLHSGLCRHVVVGGLCGTVDRSGVCVRSRRILCVDGGWLDRRGGVGLGFFAQGHRHDHFRILLGLVGTDINSGMARFTLDMPELADGIGFVAVAMGVLPGGGAVLASFASYTLEKKIKLKSGELPLGQGNIRGVAAPESANNAGAQTSFIPLLTLGIPPNAVMALMVGAMTIHNIQPGPQVMTVNPELFWGLIVSMWIGNLMLIVLNLPMIGLWIKLLTVPYHYLFPAIVLFCAIGVYTTNNSTFDIWLVALFGLAGYVFTKLGCEPAPLLLGFILGPMLEEYLKRALKLARGDWSVFITRPLSAALLALGLLLLLLVLLPAIKSKRKEAFVED
jgi:hypothetical protein